MASSGSAARQGTAVSDKGGIMNYRLGFTGVIARAAARHPWRTLALWGVAIVLAVAEVFIAKLRLFRVPELLAGSFLLALLAVTASSFLASAR